MPMRLDGSCRCGSVSFTVDSHTPVPYQRCYCSICRKSAGSGGFAINLGAAARTLQVRGRTAFFHATLDTPQGPRKSTAERHFCPGCGSPLWLFSPEWPDLVHPHASAIDTALPEPPSRVHLMLGSRAPWVQPDIRPGDSRFDGYPELSSADWHRAHGVWVD